MDLRGLIIYDLIWFWKPILTWINSEKMAGKTTIKTGISSNMAITKMLMDTKRMRNLPHALSDQRREQQCYPPHGQSIPCHSHIGLQWLSHGLPSWKTSSAHELEIPVDPNIHILNKLCNHYFLQSSIVNKLSNLETKCTKNRSLVDDNKHIRFLNF